MARKWHAGRSAAATGRKRKKAVSGWQQGFSAAAVVSVLIFAALFVGLNPLLVLGIGVVLLIATVLVLWNRWRHKAPVDKSWSVGAEGELKTAAVLNALPDDYFVFHDVIMGNSSANIDHVVIGPTGVFVLDSKNWARTIEKDRWGRWSYNSRPVARTIKSTMAETMWVVDALDPEVKRWGIYVHAAWVMTKTEQHFDRMELIDLVNLRSLQGYLTGRPDILNKRQVRRLESHARSVFRQA